MKEQVDARGLSCPQPVILTKKALDAISKGQILTIVDNEAAKDNIITMAENSHFDTSVEQKDNEFFIRITKKEVDPYQEDMSSGDIVALISSNVLGRGNDELGGILMKSFLYAFLENDQKPKSLIFVNSGVKLACENSEALEHLMALEKQGVEILSCGTCLDFYQIKEKLCIGQVSNMYTIVEKMTNADKVINI